VAFSDQVATLSNQAKDLAESASAVRQRNEDRIAKRKAELHAIIEAQRKKFGDEGDAVDEIDIAIYSIRKAEYHILDAVHWHAGAVAKKASRS
jgi:hypothetical protein